MLENHFLMMHGRLSCKSISSQTNWNFFQSLSESLHVSHLLCPSHSSHFTKVGEQQLKWLPFLFSCLLKISCCYISVSTEQRKISNTKEEVGLQIPFSNAFI